MKKILIGTALAGMIVGAFASLSFAAPRPARLDNGSRTAIATGLRATAGAVTRGIFTAER